MIVGPGLIARYGADWGGNRAHNEWCCYTKRSNRARWLLALMLLPYRRRDSSLPPMRPDLTQHVEAEMMTNLRRTLLTAAMMGIVSAGAFAQKNSNDNKRPPKDPPKVVVKDKDKPRSNSNQDKNKKGKP